MNIELEKLTHLTKPGNLHASCENFDVTDSDEGGFVRKIKADKKSELENPLHLKILRNMYEYNNANNMESNTMHDFVVQEMFSELKEKPSIFENNWVNQNLLLVSKNNSGEQNNREAVVHLSTSENAKYSISCLPNDFKQVI